MAALEIPYGGFVLEPPELRFEETVVFVHHWGGQKNSPRDHMNFVSSLGFRCVSFSQSFHSHQSLRPRKELLPKALKGLRHVWTQEILEVLDAIPGQKILYSFSMPSGAALMALAQRIESVKAWICDGGPFFQAHKCYWNYFTHQKPIKNWLLKESAVIGSHFLFGNWNFKAEVKDALNALPKDYPVLSIRGWQDPLVPPSAIEEVFRHAPQVQLEVVSLPEAQHINGIRVATEEYKNRLSRFLNRVDQEYMN